MADASNDLTFRISTPADTSGSERTTESLRKLVDVAKKAGVDTSALEDELASLTAEPARKQIEALRIELQELINVTAAAGGNTAALEARLAALSTPAPAKEIERLTAAQKEAAALDIKIPDYLRNKERATREAAAATMSGAESIEKLNSATSGSIGGIMHLGRAIKGLSVAFAANPVLAGVAALLMLKDAALAAGGVIGNMVARARGLADEIRGIQRADLTKTLEDMKTKGDTALEKIAKDASEAASAIDRLNAGVAEASGRYDALAAAALKVKLADLDLEEAQRMEKAGTETDRASIRSEFAARRADARTEAEASSIDRADRFQGDRMTEADRQQEAARARIAEIETRYNTTQRTIDTVAERGRTQKGDTAEGKATLDTLRLLRAELETLKGQLAKVREEEGKNIEAAKRTRQEAETALKVNAASRAALASTSQASSINAARADEKAAADAAEKDRRTRLEAERELEMADASNIGARTRDKLGSVPKGAVDEKIVKDATAKAEALATGDATAAEGQALAGELGKLIAAVEKIPGATARQEAANYKAILGMVREATSRMEKIEAQLASGRTLNQ